MKKIPEIVKGDNRRYFKPLTEEEITELLQKKPPRVEKVSLIEMYKLDENGKRIRRICGHRKNKTFPNHVPYGVPNPHGVKDPRNEYVCCNDAGKMTNHLGIGPCWYHSSYQAFRSDPITGQAFGRIYWLGRQFDQLVKEHFLNGEGMPGGVMTGRDAMEVLNDPNSGADDSSDFTPISLSMNFDGYLQKVKENMTPEELLDSVRLLYELEASRQMVKDKLALEGNTNLDDIKEIADNILKMATFQKTMAQRDAELMRAKAVQMICQVFTTGVLAVIADVIDKKAAIEVLTRIKETVVLPIDEFGYTEMFKRQAAAGLHKKVEAIAVSTEDIP